MEEVIRDKYGTWLGRFSNHIRKYYIIVMKIWGVYEGLIQASDKGYKKVGLQIDSKEIHATLIIENYKM